MSKNQLQEHFQKLKQELPKYNTVRVGGQDHKPIWVSTVILFDGSFFTGITSENKTEAEISAALKALKRIESMLVSDPKITNMNLKKPAVNSEVDDFEDDFEDEENMLRDEIDEIENLFYGKSVCIMIDVENLPLFASQIPPEILRYKDVKIYAFVGTHHALASKDFGPRIKKILSPSTRTDGTDCCMQVYTGCFLTDEAFESYFIATRDHFGSALIDMITAEGTPWKAKKAKLVTEICHIKLS
jgi:hypothetical protein